MPRRSRSYSSKSRSNERAGGWSKGRGGRDRDNSSPPRGKGQRGQSPNFDSACQIYIARFSSRTRESDLKRAFDRYGRIISIDIKYHGCFAFIVFASASQALDAIEDMHGRTLSSHDSERLVVEQAGSKRDRRGRGGGRHRSRSPYRGRDKRDANRDLCYNCGKEGHWANDCKEDVVARKNDLREGRCFSCGKKGHKRIDCPRDNRAGRSFSSSRSRSRSRSKSLTPSRSRKGRGRKQRSVSSSRSSYKRPNRSKSTKTGNPEQTTEKSGKQRRSSISRSRSRSPAHRRRTGHHRRSRSPPVVRQPRRSREEVQRDERQAAIPQGGNARTSGAAPADNESFASQRSGSSENYARHKQQHNKQQAAGAVSDI